MSKPAFKLPAFAKINWVLRVHGRRPDGFHQIHTVLQTVSLHDTLHFSARSDGNVSLSCDNQEIPTDGNNLILAAAEALRNRFEPRAGAEIYLEKRIPAKGGLGGGSADAAVALLGLAQLWGMDLNASELTEMGAGLGADVPFFFFGGRALGLGIGADVIPLPDLARVCLLIVTPNARVSTGDAYRLLEAGALTSMEVDSILAGPRAPGVLERFDQGLRHNDFEPLIFRIEPEIERARQVLLEAGAREAMLAGSGSSVFGIFDNQAAQERALNKIQAEAGWLISPCVTLSRQDYLRAIGSWGAQLLRSFKLRSDTGA